VAGHLASDVVDDRGPTAALQGGLVAFPQRGRVVLRSARNHTNDGRPKVIPGVHASSAFERDNLVIAGAFLGSENFSLMAKLVEITGTNLQW
jgi:hypothetical protein